MWMIRHLIEILFPSSCLACKTKGRPICDPCLKNIRMSFSSPHAFITPVFDYSDPTIRKAIRLMKYSGRKDLVDPLSSQLAKKIRDMPDHGSYVLVPVPMPSLRRLARGYNQSELLALQTGSKLRLPVDLRLLRRCATPARQVSSSRRSERLRNQKGTFACGDASGKKVILIDDVATTGSTLLEARKTLLSAHACDVVAFVVAH